MFEVFTSHECRPIRIPHSDQAPPSSGVDEFKSRFDRVALLEHVHHWAALGIEGIRNCRIGFDAGVRWIRRDNLRFFRLRSIRLSELRRWWRLKGLRTAFVIFFGAVDSEGSWFSLVAMGAVFFVSPMSAWEIRETVSGLLQTRTISPIRQATLRTKNKGPALRLRLFEFTGTTLALCRVFSHSAKVLRSVCETCRQGR